MKLFSDEDESHENDAKESVRNFKSPCIKRKRKAEEDTEDLFMKSVTESNEKIISILSKIGLFFILLNI